MDLDNLATKDKYFLAASTIFVIAAITHAILPYITN